MNERFAVIHVLLDLKMAFDIVHHIVLLLGLSISSSNKDKKWFAPFLIHHIGCYNS